MAGSRISRQTADRRRLRRTKSSDPLRSCGWSSEGLFACADDGAACGRPLSLKSTIRTRARLRKAALWALTVGLPLLDEGPQAVPAMANDGFGVRCGQPIREVVETAYGANRAPMRDYRRSSERRYTGEKGCCVASMPSGASASLTALPIA